MASSKHKIFPAWVLWLFLTPVGVFILLIALLYVPPVQNFVCTEASRYASESMGLDISVGRIDLRFPLNLVARDINVIKPAERESAAVEILKLDNINIRVQPTPLLRSQVEIDNIQIDSLRLNTDSLIDGMRISGTIGRFFLSSHSVDLSQQTVVLNTVSLDGGDVNITMLPSVEETDSTSAPLAWIIDVLDANMKDVKVGFSMPADTLDVSARISDASLSGGLIDLGKTIFGCRSLTLHAPSLYYDTSYLPAASGFDASHIALHDITAEIDSAYYAGRNIHASLRQMSFYDRSGLTLSSLTGTLHSDNRNITIPDLHLLTPNSEASLQSTLPWSVVEGQAAADDSLSLQLSANIGREDVLLFVGDSVGTAFKESYPQRPLIVNAAATGNLARLSIPRLEANLPGAFSVDGSGIMTNLTDSILRRADLDIEAETGKLNFLLALAGITPDGSVVIPDSIGVAGNMQLHGSEARAELTLAEEQGSVYVNGSYNTTSQDYEALLRIDSLRIDHFLPHDSIRNIAATIEAQGRGLDFASRSTTSQFEAVVDQIQYQNYDLSNMRASGTLAEGLLQAQLAIDNAIATTDGTLSMRTDTRNLQGSADLDIKRIDLYRLGLMPSQSNGVFALDVSAVASADSAQVDIKGGDMDLRLKSLTSLEEMLERGGSFDKVLLSQIEARSLDHAALREALPAAGFRLRAGQNNPLNSYLRTQGIRFHNILVNYGATPDIGINGRAEIDGLRVDSFQLDTVYLAIRQDTSQMKISGGVINGPRNPQYVFKANIDGTIRTEDAALDLHVVDGKGNTGILLGVNATPLHEQGPRHRANGVLFKLTPEQPIIAFRNFEFDEGKNWLYLHQDNRAYADIDMDSDDGLCFRVLSDMTDTVSLQNMNVELNRLNLKDLSATIPYIPEIAGLFSADLSFVQTATTMQLSSEAVIDELTYEKRRVGDLGLGLTWLPGLNDESFVDAYMSYDDQEVITSNGTLHADSLSLDTYLDHTPLRMLDAFIPDGMVNFLGSLHGDVSVTGTLDKPRVDGQVHMDSVYILSQQAGAQYRLDNSPVEIVANKMTFDKFAIYTTSENPFTIDGVIDFTDVAEPTANLTLLAENYTLLDAPRTRESLLFGKIFVDINATVRGALSALTMRGQMNILGDTNATYVMANSPLTVEDRLEGLVTFVSFDEVDNRSGAEETTMSLGGMDMIMVVHIDDAVRLRANLTNDGNKYVELEGGGDLNMTYTPQGDMTLNGRYTLTGGTMKYSLPVIPLKEFTFTKGSYVEWRGALMNPRLSLVAAERVRANVSDGSNSNDTRRVDFDVSVSINGQLESPELAFDLSAPNDGNIENELQTMGTDERSKAAITMLATGMYLGGTSSAGNMNMGTALSSVLQSQINSLAGSVSSSSFSVGVEDRSASTGTQIDYTFRYSQRFFNDRVQINIGGKVSTGSNASNSVESFIDNVSLEYRLDANGTRYIRAFHDKNYENILEGEVTETGVGIVFRKKMDSLSELFLFRKKKDSTEGDGSQSTGSNAATVVTEQ